jgi:small subunit ribosomal protein S2
MIPGNDDAIRAIALYAQAAADAVLEGLAARQTEMPASDEEFVEVQEEPKVKVVAKKRSVANADVATPEGESQDPGAKTKRAPRSRGKPAAG